MGVLIFFVIRKAVVIVIPSEAVADEGTKPIKENIFLVEWIPRR